MSGRTMTVINIEKEWAAIDGETIVEKADTKDQLLNLLREKGKDPDEYDIVALPKPYRSMFV